MIPSRRFLMCILLGLALGACGFIEKKADLNVRPAWIDNPGNGVSASAGMHVRGRVAQEELAIFRAREEYAKRFGVTIESEQAVGTTVANERITTVGAKVAREEVRQTGVRAEVRAKWRDPDSDVLWVWLVPSN